MTGLCRLSALVVVLAGCTDPAPAGPASGVASDAFEEISRITLDTAVVATIGRLNAWLPQDDRVLVADGMTNRILSFGLDGTYQGAVGGPGEGPGEFQTPYGLLEMPDGSILVSDFTSRLTELTPDLSLRAVHRISESFLIGALTRVGDDVVLGHWMSRGSGHNFVRWEPTGGLGPTFDPRDDPPPYCTERALIASRSSDVIVAQSMHYPLRRYTSDGTLLDSLGTPPPSWRQASRPELNEFSITPEGQQRAREWQRSYSVIDGLFALGDDWLLVAHRDPTSQYREDDAIRADLYRGRPLAKVWEDVLLPGPVLGSGDRCAWVVVQQPPDPWTLACWAPRAPSGAP